MSFIPERLINSQPLPELSEGTAATPSRAVMRGKVGGLTTVLRYGANRIAARARDGLWARFEREADPDGVLPPHERHRRAKLVERGYYAALTLKSVKARRSRKAGHAETEAHRE